MKLYIKNMVCQRCSWVVRQELEELLLPVKQIELGEITLARPITEEEQSALTLRLQSHGFEIIDNRKSRIIEQIKTAVIEWVRARPEEGTKQLSEYLTQKLLMDYSYISHLFSEIESTTIEHYHIAQKIERVKELLVYDELTLSEIAHRLHYSSVAHLSNQFKKVTGLTPTHFKQVRMQKRIPLDKV